MKKMYRIAVMILVLCLCACTAFAEEEWEYEGGMEVIAPDIELKSNPSTGYHWFFTCDEPTVVEVVENGFYSDSEAVLGAPGHETFRLYGAEEGFAVVTFSYARSAEATPLYAITYHIIVEEDLNVVIFQTSFDWE